MPPSGADSSVSRSVGHPKEYKDFIVHLLFSAGICHEGPERPQGVS